MYKSNIRKKSSNSQIQVPKYESMKLKIIQPFRIIYQEHK